jgi:hypothetical protein
MVSGVDFSFMGMFLPPALLAFVIYAVFCFFMGIHPGYTFAFLYAFFFF